MIDWGLQEKAIGWWDVCLPRCANALRTDSLQSRSRRAPSRRASKRVCALQVSNPATRGRDTNSPLTRKNGSSHPVTDTALDRFWHPSCKSVYKVFFRGNREAAQVRSDGRVASNFSPNAILFRAIAYMITEGWNVSLRHSWLARCWHTWCPCI